MQRLGRHELTHQRRLSHARGAQHGDPEWLRDAWAAGTARLPGRRQRRAGAGPRRARVRTSATAAATAGRDASATAAADAAAAGPTDHRVIRRRQVFRAESKSRADTRLAYSIYHRDVN